MKIAIAGGHGKIALLLGERLSPDHDVVGLVRRAEQAPDLEAVGMEASVTDLEEVSVPDLADVLVGCDALVFSAGAGPGSPTARTETVDYGGAVTCVRAAEAAEVPRFVMVSSMGTDHPPTGDSVFAVYLRAKARADIVLQESALEWTVVRPGRLTNDEGTGRVRLARHVGRAEIPRHDVAGVLAEVLVTDHTIRRVFEVVGGDTPIPEAVSALRS